MSFLSFFLQRLYSSLAGYIIHRRQLPKSREVQAQKKKKKKKRMELLLGEEEPTFHAFPVCPRLSPCQRIEGRDMSWIDASFETTPKRERENMSLYSFHLLSFMYLNTPRHPWTYDGRVEPKDRNSWHQLPLWLGRCYWPNVRLICF